MRHARHDTIVCYAMQDNPGNRARFPARFARTLPDGRGAGRLSPAFRAGTRGWHKLGRCVDFAAAGIYRLWLVSRPLCAIVRRAISKGVSLEPAMSRMLICALIVVVSAASAALGQAAPEDRSPG